MIEPIVFYALFIVIALVLFNLFPKEQRKFLTIVFLSAFLLRLVAWFFFNIIIFKNTFEHPDSYYWHDQGIAHLEMLKSFDFNFFSPYSNLFSKFIGLVYFLFGIYPTLIEFTNIFFGALIPIVGFFLGQRIFDLKTAKIASILLLLDLYSIYLSTQFLKDIPFIFFVILTFLAVLNSNHILFFVSLFSIGMMRGIFLPFILIPVFIYLIFNFFKDKKILKFLGFFIIIVFVVFTFNLIPAVQNSTKATLSVKKPSFVKSHTEFFDENQPKEFKNKLEFFIWLPFAAIYRSLLSPFPWQANNLREILFAGYMIWWYALIPFIIYGIYLALKNAKAEVLVLLLFSIITLLILSIVYPIAPLARWRLISFISLIFFSSFGIRKFTDKIKIKNEMSDLSAK